MAENRKRPVRDIKLTFMVIGIVLAVCLTVCLLIALMHRTIQKSVYEDRRSLLARLTETNARTLDDNMSYGQDIMDMIADNACRHLPDYPTVEDYFAVTAESASYDGIVYFFVDVSGKYVCSDGVSGKITDIEYYTDSSGDSLSYISSLPHMDPEKVYLIFRNRLASPVRIQAGQEEMQLVYCGYLFDIDELNETVSESFAGANNSFIFDDTSGVMLYKNFGIEMLIEGFNIYPKFSRGEIIYGGTPEELEQACRNRETVVALMEINGEEYYYCSAPTEVVGWSVAFIVQGRFLDEISGNSFINIVVYISIIAAILGGTALFSCLAVYRKRMSDRSVREVSQLNEELQRATRAKSDFLSNMSHDIRTPINGIMGMTTIAKGVEGNPARTSECLDKIDSASRHLLSLINDVLDMSRIEQGRTEISFASVDLRVIADNCCSIIRGQMIGRELNLISEISCEHPRVLGDDLHLRQIFINILGNAVKFTPDGGTIRFTARELSFSEDNALVAFEIEDTGIGMKPEFLSHIFEPFTQEDGGARTRYKGTGLGMAITRQLTELMGGTVTVESELNKGSKFTVTIPFAVDTAVPEETAVEDAEADISGVKILLAEDNELNREIAVELLEDLGAVLTPVEDGQQALDTFRDSAPGTFDVILMDVMMPVMNGLEATKAIRALPREDAQTIPILAMTANAFESDIRASAEAGMNAHLLKPIDIGEVTRNVARFARKQ